MDWNGQNQRENQRPTDFDRDEPTSTKDVRFIGQLFAKYLNERKRTRRWGIFFKTILVFYLGILIVNLSGIEIPTGTFSKGRIAALIDVAGVIESDGEASAENILLGLDEAFRHPKTVGVIIRLNTPGGSPVQSGQVYDGILSLKTEFPNIPVVALIEDICASGGYYVAVAADQIFANKASIVGSIGVRMDSFGLAEAIKKMGVERRSIVAGENKDFLDPFKPIDKKHRLHAEAMLQEIHEQFKDVVRVSRSGKLQSTDANALFSGLVWTGERSVQLGLVDELGSLKHIVHEVLQADAVVSFTKVDYSIEGIFSKVVFSLYSRFR